MTYVMFPFSPDWSENIELSYGYFTALEATPRLREQRRPLKTAVTRTQSFMVRMFTKYDSALFENYCKSIHATKMYMPVFSEELQMAGTGVIGASPYTVTNILTDKYSLSITSLIGFVDKTGLISPEVQTLTSYNTTNKTLSPAVDPAGSFLKQNTVIYPLFLALIDSYTSRDITDSITEFKLTFKEII